MAEQRGLKKSRITAVLMTAVITIALVLVMREAAFADNVPLEPKHGIPLVIVRIDESAEAIAAAETASGNDYGTIAEMNSSENHSVRCTGTVEIKVPAGYSGEYGSVEVPDGEVSLDFIRGRGNSTWETTGHTKKPYKIKYAKKQDLFGMGKNKEWALMANANDETLLKNRIVSWLGERMGFEYTPQMIPVDVVMIGSISGAEELGSYCLSELVSVGESRLSIEDAKLLAIYNGIQDEGDPFFKTGSGLEIKYEDPEEENPQVEDFMNDLEKSIMGPEKIDHTAISEKMDLKSAANYWWIQELVCNNDAFNTSSTYMYIDPKAPAGGAAAGWKLFWGPLWDFDLTLLSTGEGEEGNTRFGFNNTQMSWFDRLRDSDPLFDEILVQQWDKLDPLLTELTSEGGIMDQMEAEISASWARDREVWKDYYNPWDDEETSLDAEVEKARTWLVKRQAWINNNIGLVGTVYHKVTYYADGNEIGTEAVRGGSSADAEVEAPDKEGCLFLRWEDRESGADLNEINVEKDLTVDAVYISQEDTVKPERIYFSKYEDWVPLDDEIYLGVDMEVYPKDAFVSKVKWTSSDESVATVNRRGEVQLLSEGSVTISATMYNGVSRSFVLHIYDPGKVSPQLPSGISAEPLDLEAGQTEQIRYSILPEGGIFPNCIVLFESEGSDCIEVDESLGIVTALKPGKAIVTVHLYTSDQSVEATDQCTVTVTGDRKSIAGARVVLSKKVFTYNGKVRKPSIRTIGGMSLKEGSDYTVKWSDAGSKNVGSYTVTIKGRGWYSGTVKATYKIIPKGTSLKKPKAGKRSATVRWTRQAAGMSKSRITGYQIQLATDRKFTGNRITKTVKGYRNTSKKITRLKAKKKYFIRIRTYRMIGKNKYWSAWSKPKTVITE